MCAEEPECCDGVTMENANDVFAMANRSAVGERAMAVLCCEELELRFCIIDIFQRICMVGLTFSFEMTPKDAQVTTISYITQPTNTCEDSAIRSRTVHDDSCTC
jgi:hypothetical protein